MILKIGIIAVVSIVVLAVVKNGASPYSSVLRIGVIAVILISVIPDIGELTSVLGDMGISSDISTQSLKIMIRIFAVLTVGSLCSDVCRDNGESAVADTVELSSKIIAVSYAVPVITSVVSVAVAFLKG